MSILSLVTKENPQIRQAAQLLPKNFRKSDFLKLIRDMRDTMRAREGIGIAASQVGQPLRLFVIDEELFEKKPKHSVFINPRLKKKTFKRIAVSEGCLSVPRIFGTVNRYTRVTVEATDENGKKFVMTATELLARVLQHELDHLDGILFIDKAEPGTLHEVIPEESGEKNE